MQPRPGGSRPLDSPPFQQFASNVTISHPNMPSQYQMQNNSLETLAINTFQSQAAFIAPHPTTNASTSNPPTIDGQIEANGVGWNSNGFLDIFDESNIDPNLTVDPTASDTHLQFDNAQALQFQSAQNSLGSGIQSNKSLSNFLGLPSPSLQDHRPSSTPQMAPTRTNSLLSPCGMQTVPQSSSPSQVGLSHNTDYANRFFPQGPFFQQSQFNFPISEQNGSTSFASQNEQSFPSNITAMFQHGAVGASIGQNPRQQDVYATLSEEDLEVAKILASLPSATTSSMPSTYATWDISNVLPNSNTAHIPHFSSPNEEPKDLFNISKGVENKRKANIPKGAPKDPEGVIKRQFPAAFNMVATIDPGAVSLHINAVTSNTASGNSNQRPVIDKNFRLVFSSPDEARARAYPRDPLDLREDDVDAVWAAKEDYVVEIMHALLHQGYLDSSGQRRKKLHLTQEEAGDWKRWQEGHVDSVGEILEIEDLRWVESRAWMVFEEIVKIHREGHRLSALDAERHLKCSERVWEAITVIADYAIIRYDILTEIKLHEFAKSPNGFAKSKTDTLWNNWRKKDKKTKTEADAAAAKAQQATKGVNGGKGASLNVQAFANKEKHVNLGEGANVNTKEPRTRKRAVGNSIKKRHEPSKKRQAKPAKNGQIKLNPGLLINNDDEVEQSDGPEDGGVRAGFYKLTRTGSDNIAPQTASSLTTGKKRKGTESSTEPPRKRSKGTANAIASQDVSERSSLFSPSINQASTTPSAGQGW